MSKNPQTVTEHQVKQKNESSPTDVDKKSSASLDKELAVYHQVANQSYGLFDKLVEDLRVKLTDPEMSVDTRVSEMKNKVDLRVEQLKLMIDTSSSAIINKLDDIKSKFSKESMSTRWDKCSEDLLNLCDGYKALWKVKLDSSEIGKEMLDEINKHIRFSSDRLVKIDAEIENDLEKTNQVYGSLKFMDQMISSMFGGFM